MLGIAGPVLSAAERDWLRHPAVGGVILFTRNYASPEQVTSLTAQIHAARTPPLLIAVDQEGGPVQRFRDGFTRLPPVNRLGRVYDQDPVRARHLAAQCGWLMAAELRAVGVDLSFAPVLDLDRGVSAVIGERAFHRDPEVVADLAQHYIHGMQRAGMAAVGKHFPGHGSVAADSHRALPVDPRPLETLGVEDLLPFERAADQGIPGVMIAHVLYPAIDAQLAGYSRYWIHDVLRARLRFQGAVFSDDLGMVAAHGAGTLTDRANVALTAGCDMVLVCNEGEATGAVLDALAGYRDPAAQMRLARMRGGGHGLARDAMCQLPEWSQAVSDIAACDPDPELGLDLA